MGNAASDIRTSTGHGAGRCSHHSCYQQLESQSAKDLLGKMKQSPRQRAPGWSSPNMAERPWALGLENLAVYLARVMCSLLTGIDFWGGLEVLRDRLGGGLSSVKVRSIYQASCNSHKGERSGTHYER
jgi:hypothetical protein